MRGDVDRGSPAGERLLAKGYAYPMRFPSMPSLRTDFVNQNKAAETSIARLNAHRHGDHRAPTRQAFLTRYRGSVSAAPILTAANIGTPVLAADLKLAVAQQPQFAAAGVTTLCIL